MQNKKGNIIKRIVGFAEDKGFYIILGLCIVAIGISGYVLFFTGGADDVAPSSIKDPVITWDDPTESVFGNEIIKDTPKPTEPEDPSIGEEVEPGGSFEEIFGNNTETPVPPELPRVDTASADEPDELVNNPISVPVYSMPAKGEIIKPFSITEHLYDETMDDWRVHNGIDIACDIGTPVITIATGVVTSLGFDEMTGYYVKVTHDDGLVSTYYGLQPNNTLTAEMRLEDGDEIGLAGNTMLAEIAQPEHIHVTIARDGEYIDPMSILGK